uniref:Uncharacterized protein n=1 Tax=Anguilla anguilla TaxID=7936 RepID=A0A0E9RDD1_ANGAN
MLLCTVLSSMHSCGTKKKKLNASGKFGILAMYG